MNKPLDSQQVQVLEKISGLVGLSFEDLMGDEDKFPPIPLLAPEEVN